MINRVINGWFRQLWMYRTNRQTTRVMQSRPRRMTLGWRRRRRWLRPRSVTPGSRPSRTCRDSTRTWNWVSALLVSATSERSSLASSDFWRFCLPPLWSFFPSPDTSQTSPHLTRVCNTGVLKVLQSWNFWNCKVVLKLSQNLKLSWNLRLLSHLVQMSWYWPLLSVPSDSLMFYLQQYTYGSHDYPLLLSLSHTLRLWQSWFLV